MSGAPASAGVTPYLILGTYPGAMLFWISFDPAIETACSMVVTFLGNLSQSRSTTLPAWSPKAPVTSSQGARSQRARRHRIAPQRASAAEQHVLGTMNHVLPDPLNGE